MDEATSSLDVEIDATVQGVIRERFQGYAIIAIAHRATAIQDFDRVAVFNDGELVEFDDPRVLIEREMSLFKEVLKARSDWRE